MALKPWRRRAREALKERWCGMMVWFNGIELLGVEWIDAEIAMIARTTDMAK